MTKEEFDKQRSESLIIVEGAWLTIDKPTQGLMVWYFYEGVPDILYKSTWNGLNWETVTYHEPRTI